MKSKAAVAARLPSFGTGACCPVRAAGRWPVATCGQAEI